MTEFLQLHFLTVYPPSNPNRDDTGRPKTAVFGNATRLRLSSQSLKRAWRTSDLFKKGLEGHVGERTQRIGKVVLEHLKERGVERPRALEISRLVADVFGKLVKETDKEPSYIEQLAFISPEERAEAIRIADRLYAGENLLAEGDDDEVPDDGKKKKKEKKLPSNLILRTADTAVDIAMFGRMLADDPDFNREAAVQVAHAITTHKVLVEDDYYTAVDDLKRPSEDAGAGFIGEAGFGSGVFYLYVCIDRDLLVRNLGGDAALAARGIEALVEAAATVAPKGKQASFANRARCAFALAERGSTAPRTLASAFLKPIAGEDVLASSIAALQDTRDAFDRAYGENLGHAVMNVSAGQGTLAEVIAFALDGQPVGAGHG